MYDILPHINFKHMSDVFHKIKLVKHSPITYEFKEITVDSSIPSLGGNYKTNSLQENPIFYQPCKAVSCRKKKLSHELHRQDEKAPGHNNTHILRAARGAQKP